MVMAIMKLLIVAAFMFIVASSGLVNGSVVLGYVDCVFGHGVH